MAGGWPARVLEINWGRPAFASPARSRTGSGEPPVLVDLSSARVQREVERAPGPPGLQGASRETVAQAECGMTIPRMLVHLVQARCLHDHRADREVIVQSVVAAPPGTPHRAPVACKLGFAGTQARPIRSPLALDLGHPGGPRCAGTLLGSAQECQSRDRPPVGSSARRRGLPPVPQE